MSFHIVSIFRIRGKVIYNAAVLLLVWDISHGTRSSVFPPYERHRFLRPHALPIVTPFHVDAPRGVVLLADTYEFQLDLSESNASMSVVKNANARPVESTISAHSPTYSVDIKFHTPQEGAWFLGVFFSDASVQTRCYAPLYAEVFYEVMTNIQSIMLPSTVENIYTPSKTPPIAFKMQRSVIFAKRDSQWSRRFNRRPRRETSIRSHLVRRRRMDITSTTASNGSNQSSPGLMNSKSQRVSTSATQSIIAELAPSKGRLFRIIIDEEVTSIDLRLTDCAPLTPFLSSPATERTVSNRPATTLPSDSTSSSRWRRTRRSKSQEHSTLETSLNCAILLDFSSGSLPSSVVNVTNQSLAVNETDAWIRKTLERRLHQTYRVDRLSGYPAQTHYLYLYNPGKEKSIRVHMLLTPNAACPSITQSGHNPSTATSPRSSEKRATDEPITSGTKRIERLEQPSTDNSSGGSKSLTNTTTSTANNGTRANQSTNYAFSLLPWLSSVWPPLMPRRSSSSGDETRVTMDDSVTIDPREMVHSTLEKCNRRTPPARVSGMHAFAYYFNYHPELRRPFNGLRLQPWKAVAIPFNLDGRHDVGGTLEISLQLNAYDLTWRLNDTHLKPIPRQVILHACFARHVATTASHFIDPHRCPVWLRLATSHGVAVSVAHAVWAAVSETLAHSQPPHRSELRTPNFDTSFNLTVDRSFLYLPYPPPGPWFLTLYAECYTTTDTFCSENTASSIDVGLVIRSSPCLNYRCRDSGEGASLTPSAVLDARFAEPRKIGEQPSSSYMKTRWRPPWWHSSDLQAFHSPMSNWTFDDPITMDGEGLCVELLQTSIFAATCACPPGRFGIGCMRPSDLAEELTVSPPVLDMEYKEEEYRWTGFSSQALWLALSNLAFLPGICLALIRRLWIPAIAYTYTLVFSSLYHLCDTDVMNIPNRLNVRTIGGDVFSFGGHALLKSRGYQLSSNEPSGFRTAASGLQFTSPMCPLPLDVLSFCDFFGGIFSFWVTVVAACACPLWYAQMAYVVFILAWTVMVQIARYSVAFYLCPIVFGVAMLVVSWAYRSHQTNRLFPPVQWWLLSLFPGLFCALAGLMLFTSSSIARDYTRLHSLWHILIGSSLLGILPWPDRWRRALLPAIPIHTALSCGGAQRKHSPPPPAATAHLSTRSSVSPWHIDELNSPIGDGPVDSMGQGRLSACCGYFRPSRMRWYKSKIHCSRPRWYILCEQSCRRAWEHVDRCIELQSLLDALVRQWPKARWLLPHGYRPKSICRGHHSISTYVTPHPASSDKLLSHEETDMNDKMTTPSRQSTTEQIDLTISPSRHCPDSSAL